ncbi:GTP cyclohydrolase I [Streptomyces sp. NBC_01190]|uniref:GTP cyclohydrolase I n=1 Tax=Streptomyces sp. NBC_01190 TaxID=2903767 RepID=UPI00386F87E9|nr:GTP cyclohydrolase I [Streptomyces sp. NBC_01190]
MTNTLYSQAPGGTPPVGPLSVAPSAVGRVDTERITGLINQLLTALGEDPAREGLLDTPARVASWWAAFLSPEPPSEATCFTETRLGEQLVVVGSMSVWSLCEHHLLPMNLDVSVGYVPEGQVVGLSKFGRIARRHAGRLQVQERFTRLVAADVVDLIRSQDVAVAVRGVHLCMSMRGVRMESARTTTLQSGGRFQSDPVLSQQFLALATGQQAVA